MAQRRGWLPVLRGRSADRLLPLTDALDALGGDGVMGDHRGEVPITQVVGSLARAGDFDADFGLTNRGLLHRWERVLAAVDAGVPLPPVRLIQLGELYFVVDGHHRISVARTLRQTVITAQVRRICTIAYAMCCLRLAHLPSKAAERAFLQRIPLADELRAQLWLDSPAGWPRLADAAESWAFTESLHGRTPVDRSELARRWWTYEVLPLVQRLRAEGTGAGLRDFELYAAALGVRDRLGRGDWTDDVAGHLERR